MRLTVVLVAFVFSTSAFAKPIEIDLTPERRAYEAKAQPRKAGLALLAGTLALGIVSAYGYSQASDARAELLAQRAPVDLARRQELVAQGTRGNAVGLGGALLGIGAAIGSVYFLSVSF